MSENKKILSTNAILNEEKLKEVVGGASSASSNNRAVRTNKQCIECLKGTNLPNRYTKSFIYKAGNSNICCCQNGHIYENDIYTHFSESEVSRWFTEHI